MISKGMFSGFGLASMGSGGRQGKGVMYDISDTEPLPGTVDDFADKMGLANNLTGILNAPAIEKEKELLAADEKNKADQLANADAEKKKHLQQIATDEGKAELFLEALKKINETEKNPIQIDDSNKSPLDNYINSLIKLADRRCRDQKWSNDVDVRLMALMIAAGVSSKTVGAQRIKSLHPDFSAARFKDEGQFSTTVWPIMFSIINRMNKAVDDIYKEKNIGMGDNAAPVQTAAQVTENFRNMLKRMNKLHEEYIGEPEVSEDVDESMLPENSGMKDDVINFLKGFGLHFDNEN